mmetsp:Transcript_22848/g.48600  ORF Transcript_22848/g.48600 Transcript_22848/m.48600 type:complete len:188 (-) Transcript_22848:395-958(-)
MPETKDNSETRPVKSEPDAKLDDSKDGTNQANNGEAKVTASTVHDSDTKDQRPRPTFRQRHRNIATSKSLFVTGFAHAINKTHVERLFSKFGKPDRISDFMTSQKSSSRYCFVEYGTIEEAQKAMDKLHGRTLLHKRLVVLPAHANNNEDSSARKTAPVNMNPAKERALIDQKIAALKKKIKESRGN